MQTNEQRILFKWIMRNPNITIDKDIQTIELIYPITMEEITMPVRNTGCNQAKTCIWPLGSLMKEIQEDINKGIFKESNNLDITNHSFDCKMCLEVTKFPKRSYKNFYYDRKLDYLIRAARNKFMESFSEELEEEKNENSRGKMRKKLQRNFKNSKLILYRGGKVVLEYKKKIEEGVKVTLRAVVLENTLSHYSEQLVFNPKDYARNLSALKLAQNLAQKRIGEAIEKGFEDTQGCYTQKYRTHLKSTLNSQIKDIVDGNIQVVKKQQLYAAKMVMNQSTQNRKVLQLILFYPRSNLTQIYTFQEKEDIVNSCSKETIKIVKLTNHQLLLYTSDHSYIIQLDSQKSRLQKNTDLKFQRPISVMGSIQTIPSVEVQVKYLKNREYNKCQKICLKFQSVRPVIQSPILLANPEKPQDIFVFGGTIQGTINQYVYKLDWKQNNAKWIRQDHLIKMPSKHCQLIIEKERIFLLAFVNLNNEKAVKCRLELLELVINDGVLHEKDRKLLKEEINTQYLLPLRAKDDEYILADLTSKQEPLYLNLQTFSLIKKVIKQDIRRFIKDLYDIRNQKSIFESYPACSVTHNQITYNLLSYSVAKHTFKIYYGCEDEWMVSDLSQTLIHD